MTAFELITLYWPAAGLIFYWRRPDRIAIMAAICVGQLLFACLFKNSDDAFWYYFGAAISDFASLMVIRYLPVTRVGLDVMLLLMTSMVVNATGYILWYAYIGPHIYDSTMLALLIVQTLRIMVDDDDARDAKAAGWRNLVHRYIIGRNYQISGKAA